MMSGFFLILFCFKLVLFLVSFLGEGAKLEISDDSNSVYIVYMGATLKSAPRKDHARLMNELLKRKDCVVQTYNQSFVGFAARLSEEEARSIEEREGVVSVFRDRVSQLHTTRSWDFLMNQNAALTKEYSASCTSSPSQVSCSAAGADTIIGLFDTGIWPEHPSFSDKNMSQIPSRWKGICMPGENHTDPPFVCNKKVIGARYYDDPKEAGSIVSARDDLGHGTHTASTAAGVPVEEGASYYGLAYGTARGGSPGSRIAVYRVCSSEGCPDSGILKAFDDAVRDGVDVISISIGGKGSEDFLNDVIAIGSFHAVEKGVVVVGSGGNRGPSPGTAVNVAPWILSVAATTIDRDFQTDVVLGGNKVIKGGGINFSGLERTPVHPLVDGRTASSDQHSVSNASNCIPGSLDVGKVQGKIIVCENTIEEDNNLREKFNTLKRQLGVIGMIVIDIYLSHVSVALGASPIAIVDENNGVEIQNYIKSTGNPVATILPTAQITHYKPAPVISIFSARGPTPGNQNIIKPDIAAPGEKILAARPPINDPDLVIPGKEPPPLFYIDSGTSMSCPHVSGLAAIIKSRHPTWTPSAIKSALMTTAISTDNSNSLITTYNGSTATPYELGSGEVNPLGSLWPGLVYEIETDDYLMFLCNYGYNTSAVKKIASALPKNFFCPSNSSPDLISDLNYPSIAVSGLKTNETRTVRRTVTNVGDENSTYYATVVTPAGMQLQVVPKILRFTKTVKKLSFQVNFVLTKKFNEPLFGSFTWSNGKYSVRSPVVVSNA